MALTQLAKMTVQLQQVHVQVLQNMTIKAMLLSWFRLALVPRLLAVIFLHLQARIAFA
jgi:hypothetical protein